MNLPNINEARKRTNDKTKYIYLDKEYDKNKVMNIPLSEVWDMSQFSEWDTVYFEMWSSAKILSITDKDVTFDFNHELAGKDLIFDITMKSIN